MKTTIFYEVGLPTILFVYYSTPIEDRPDKNSVSFVQTFGGNGLVLSDTEACEGLSTGAACIAGKKKVVTKPGIFIQS